MPPTGSTPLDPPARSASPGPNPAPAPRVPADGAVDGIVLAAGRSTRMGRAKAALDLGGRTFIEHCVDLLRTGGCRGVVAVVSDRPDLAMPSGVAKAVNPDPASEQIDSIRIGLAALADDAAATLVLPVDAPAVRPGTVARLIESFRATGAPVVRPVHGGVPGHPTLFARAAFAELAAGDLSRGAETVVDRHAADRVDVPVDDPGVTGNVNTPDDYRRLGGDT